MLLAPVLPMSLPTISPRTRTRRPSLSAPAADPAQRVSQRRWLLGVWLILGALAVICIPPLRSSVGTGWTLPFWFIAAPAINLMAMAWMQRREQRRR